MHHVVVEIGLGACEQAEPDEHRPDEGRNQRGDALGVRGDGDDDADDHQGGAGKDGVTSHEELPLETFDRDGTVPTVGCLCRVQPGPTMLTASAPSSTSASTRCTSAAVTSEPRRGIRRRRRLGRGTRHWSQAGHPAAGVLESEDRGALEPAACHVEFSLARAIGGEVVSWASITVRSSVRRSGAVAA